MKTSVSGEGADGPEADEVGFEEGLCCLVLTSLQPGAEGGEELDVGVVAGCDCVQVKGVKVDDNGVPVEEGGVTLELRTTWWRWPAGHPW